jgi:hypothetical protein
VEKGLANFCRIDIINVGGFTETMKVWLLQPLALSAHSRLTQSGMCTNASGRRVVRGALR